MQNDSVALFIITEDPDVTASVSGAVRRLPAMLVENVRTVPTAETTSALQDAAASVRAIVIAEPPLLASVDPTLVDSARIAGHPLILAASGDRTEAAARDVAEGRADDYFPVREDADPNRQMVVIARALFTILGMAFPGQPEARDPVEPPETSEPAEDARPEVLVIDDDWHTQQVVGRILLGRGFAVRQAFTGSQGLIKAIRHQPSLILLDLRLPDIPGIEVLRLLRTKERTRATPVLIISSCTSREIILEVTEGRAAGYLIKPVRADMLLDRVAQVLGSPIPASPRG